MVNIRIYVEGGGDQKNLKSECRAGFKLFFKKILPDKMPRIIACGSRKNAYDRFCTAILNKDTFCILLVDSEGPVANKISRWDHLKERDSWIKPGNTDDKNVHFMVECMENWFMADKQCLAEFYGQGFILNALPKNPVIEKIPKSDILNGLKRATRNTKSKGKYGKGKHSFDILSKIDPVKVCKAKHAKILIDTIKKIQTCQKSNKK